MPPVIENGFLCLWILLLVFLAKRNSNLHSILLLMLVPKLLDIAVLSPLLQSMKKGDYRQFFYVAHSFNDLFMCLVILWRPYIHVFTGWRVVYHRLKSEWVLIGTYFGSIAVNLMVFVEFEQARLGIRPSLFFFDNYEIFKGILSYAEVAILTWLTIQTVIVVRMLRKKGFLK